MAATARPRPVPPGPRPSPAVLDLARALARLAVAEEDRAAREKTHHD